MNPAAKVLLMGIPIVYLTGAMTVGTMYLNLGDKYVMDAILFGMQWPLYIGQFLS